MKFFIVDDDPEIIDLATILLEEAGHSVQSCVAGALALAEIKSFRPDCVLTDLMMAEMDGLELCKELRGKHGFAGAKIIMVSARTNDYWRQRALQAGANGYITKPLRPESFAQEVQRIIEEAKPA